MRSYLTFLCFYDNLRHANLINKGITLNVFIGFTLSEYYEEYIRVSSTTVFENTDVFCHIDSACKKLLLDICCSRRQLQTTGSQQQVFGQPQNKMNHYQFENHSFLKYSCYTGFGVPKINVLNPAVLKLGVATLWRVAKLLKSVAKYQNYEFLILWPKIKLFYKLFYFKEGRQIFINNCRGRLVKKFENPCPNP